MAIASTNLTQKFITTEPIGKGGESSEQEVWDVVKDAFAHRTCLGYWRYPIFSKVGKSRKEPTLVNKGSKIFPLIVCCTDIKMYPKHNIIWVNTPIILQTKACGYTICRLFIALGFLLVHHPG